jgi:RND family efflux transporter MFP subunit
MKRWLLAGLPVILLGGLIGWRLRLNSADANKQAGARAARSQSAPVVALARPTVRDIVRTLDAIGTVESAQSVAVASKVSGRIRFLEVREGDEVRRGQTLVQLDPTEVEGEVRQQRANLTQARERLSQARLTEVSAGVSVSTQIRQQAAALTSAQAEERQARETFSSEVGAAQADVADRQGRVASAGADIADAEAAVEVARANLANARAKLQRTQRLVDRGFVSAQALDDARTVVEVQMSQVNAASSRLTGARAQHASAVAQQQASERQLEIVRARGQADIDSAAARVAQATAALELARANTAQTSAYRANLAALRASVGAAEGSVRSAEARRAETTIVAPADGFVTARQMDPGAMATPGATIVVVQDVRRLWVTIPAPEETGVRLRPGMRADVRFDAYPGRTSQGSVTHINAAADAASRQFMVRIGLDNRDRAIKPGMFARVSLVVDRSSGALVVPREAVRRSRDGATVTVVGADMVARTRKVVTGAEDPQGIQIVSGLTAVDRVVTMSAMPIKDGRKVRPEGSRPGGATQGRGGAGPERRAR